MIFVILKPKRILFRLKYTFPNKHKDKPKYYETLSELVDVANYNRGKVSIAEICCSVNCLNCGDNDDKIENQNIF